MSSEGVYVASKAWVAVNTQPHREAVAIEHLERQKFDVYCPMLRKRVRHARKAQDVLRPMFPGYLFVSVDAGLQGWRPIRSTIGVRSVVTCGDRLSILDAAFIAALKAREIDGAIAKPETPFAVGQQIRLSGGPFEGLIATIIELGDNERLTVLMNLLNGLVKVRIEPRWASLMVSAVG